MVGSLKEEVLIALAVEGPNTIAADVFRRTDDARRTVTNKGLSFGSVFTTLNRLLKDEMVSAISETASNGRKFRKFTITAAGQSQLNNARCVRVSIESAKKTQGGYYPGKEVRGV